MINQTFQFKILRVGSASCDPTRVELWCGSMKYEINEGNNLRKIFFLMVKILIIVANNAQHYLNKFYELRLRLVHPCNYSIKVYSKYMCNRLWYDTIKKALIVFRMYTSWSLVFQFRNAKLIRPCSII